MDNNKAHAIEIASDETEATRVDIKSLYQSEEQSADKRQFGLLDLWRLRRGARTYKIHNRIPRV